MQGFHPQMQTSGKASHAFPVGDGDAALVLAAASCSCSGIKTRALISPLWCADSVCGAWEWCP
jgi:hypothetical protein